MANEEKETKSAVETIQDPEMDWSFGADEILGDIYA